MPTKWDPTHTGAPFVLTNDDLTATNPGFSDACVLAATGAQAGAPQDVSWTATIEATPTPNSFEIGLAVQTLPLTSRPPRWPSSNSGAVALHANHGGHVTTETFTDLAAVGAFATGDRCQVRLKNGKAYFRRYASATGVWGPWNGASGTYANADPTTDTGGIPVSAGFGATTLVYPFCYADKGSFTGDFVSWATSNGGSNGGSSSGASKAFVDPHDFGAKGGARMFRFMRQYGDGREIGVDNYSFTQADVGKTFFVTDWWAAPDGRTVTGVTSTGRLVLDPTLPPPPTWWVGGEFLLGWDDTASIQAALEAAQDMGLASLDDTAVPDDPLDTNYAFGAAVLLRSDGYMIRNPLQAWQGGKRAALVVPRRTALLGASRYATKLFLGGASYGHGVANVGKDHFSDFIELGNLSLFCNANFQDLGGRDLSTGEPRPAALDGVNIHVARNGYDWVDPFTYVHDLAVFNAARDAFLFSGRGEASFRDLQAVYARRFGFYFNGQDDYTAVRLNAGGSQKTGFRIERSGTGQFVNCKSYYSGANAHQVQRLRNQLTVNPDGSGGPKEGPPVEFLDPEGVKVADETIERNAANFAILGDNPFNSSVQMSNCHAQESRGSSYLIEGGSGMYTGCVASDPGRIPVGLVDGQEVNPRPAIIAGFHLQGDMAVGNLLADCYLRSDLGNQQDSATWGYAQYGLYIAEVRASDGLGPHDNRGDVWYAAFRRGDRPAPPGETLRPTFAYTYKLHPDGAENQPVTMAYQGTPGQNPLLRVNRAPLP